MTILFLWTPLTSKSFRGWWHDLVDTVCRVVCFRAEESSPFILDSKGTYSLLWRETFSLFSQVVDYVNTLEELDQKKRCQCLCSDVQKWERPMENGLPQNTNIYASLEKNKLIYRVFFPPFNQGSRNQST
uniref:Uncharacterized protein n=1 Tax=Molossus molossus TaxID=27622 RepID=A0A7J8F971_MOLMO|nr:hypothetical protein HJG59_008548 [Molossus molossus]